MTWTGWTLADATEVEPVVEKISRLVRVGARDTRVINFARSLVPYAGQQTSGGIALSIRNWLNGHWRFVNDPTDKDYYRPALDSLGQYEHDGVIVGDCDDAAVLAGALLRSLDYPVFLDVLAFTDSPRDWRHIYAWVLTAEGNPVDYDVTKPASGSVPPVASVATFPV